MKKYLLVLLLTIFIIPSIALASWWNPFTWKIFQKKEVVPQAQVEVQKTPEEKISDLQKQLDDLKNQQPTSTTAIDVPVKTIQKKIVTKKIEVSSESSWKTIEDYLFPIADSQGLIDFRTMNNEANDFRHYTKENNKWTWKSNGDSKVGLFGGPNQFAMVGKDTMSCNYKQYSVPFCSTGQKFYCPETGDASCVSSVVNNANTTTPIPPPTAQQIAGLTRLCAMATSSQGFQYSEMCNSKTSSLWKDYFSDVNTRNAFDALVAKYDAMIANQSAVSAKQLQQTNCDYLLKSGRLALMTPWAGTLAMKEACGTATDADRMDYQTAELSNQLSRLKDTINKNQAEAFQRSDLEKLQSQPQTFGTTKWEVRFDNGGFGSVSNSLGQIYSFHCDSTSCITY